MTSLEQAHVGTGIEPSDAALEAFDHQLPAIKIGDIEVGDL